MRIILNILLSFSFIFLSSTVHCSKRSEAIDSLNKLLLIDTLSAESKVDIMTKLVVKHRYRGQEALDLTYKIDSICTIENLPYKGGINLFNRSLYYNKIDLQDSAYTRTIDAIDSIAGQMEDSQDLMLYYHWAYANYYFKTEDYTLSEKQLEAALVIADSMGLESKIPRLHNELAIRQRLLQKYFDAIDSYLKALEYDNPRSCYSYSNLAKIYRDMEDYTNQLHYAEKGRVTALKENITNVHITCRLDKARAYYRLGMLDSSEQYFLKTLPFIEDSNVKIREQIAGEYLARIYYDRQEWQKLEELKAIFDNYDDGIYHAVYYALLGQSYFDRNNISLAKKHCERGFEAGDPKKSTYWTRASCDCLIDVYTHTKKYAAALEMAGHARYMDSISNNKERFVNIARSLNNKDLEQQRILLYLEQEKKEQISQTKLMRTRLVTGFITMLSIFGFLSYWQLRKKNKKIANQNRTIKAALEEKNTLLKEIHHRVKNNLQVISSLLSMQMRHVDDESTKRILSDGKNRVRSIALIHQSLYQNNNINKISFEAYLQEMATNLFTTYNIEEQAIKLNLDIDDISLDVETMISLGLILNELLTNCLKHAFNDDKQGIINIKLDEINDQLVLMIQDNGKGVDEAVFDKNSSFGNKLLKAFSRKLKADLSIENNNGTTITMTINNYQKTAS